MGNFMKRIVLSVFCTILFVLPASAGNGLITVQSSYSVPMTLDRLTEILQSKGLTIFARIDHAAGAAKVDTKLPPTQLLIFGNPKLGTPLMTSNRTVGIDLPMKALAWRDDAGKVWLSYNEPDYLKSRHKIGDRDAVFMKITGALKKLIGKAVSP